MHDTIHEETVRSGRMMTIVGLAVVGLVLAVVALVVTVPEGTHGRPLTPPDLVVLAVLLGLTVVLAIGTAVMRLRVRVDDVLEVRVDPWWYRRRIAPRSITSATVVHMTGANSGGWGIRLVPGGTAVLLDGGPGVQVEVAGARSLRFRCNDPEAVVSALRARGASVG